MKNILSLFLLLTFSTFHTFGQEQSYRYFFANNATGHQITPAGTDRIHIVKQGDLFKIALAELKISVKYSSYNDIKNQHVYTGEVLDSNLLKGRCIIQTENKLDLFLENHGYKFDGMFLQTDNDMNYCITILMQDMKPLRQGIAPQQDEWRKIYPIENKSQEKLNIERKQETEINTQKRIEEDKHSFIDSLINQQITNENIEYYTSEVRRFNAKQLKTSILKKAREYPYANYNNYNSYPYIPESIQETFSTDVIICITDGLNIGPYIMVIKSNIGQIILQPDLYKYKYKNAEKYYNNVYKNGDMYFVKTQIEAPNDPLTRGLFRVQFTGNKYKFLGAIPNGTNKWVKANITKKGTYYIGYIGFDDDYSFEIIELNSQEESKFREANGKSNISDKLGW